MYKESFWRYYLIIDLKEFFVQSHGVVYFWFKIEFKANKITY